MTSVNPFTDTPCLNIPVKVNVPIEQILPSLLPLENNISSSDYRRYCLHSIILALQVSF